MALLSSLFERFRGTGKAPAEPTGSQVRTVDQAPRVDADARAAAPADAAAKVEQLEQEQPDPGPGRAAPVEVAAPGAAHHVTEPPGAVEAQTMHPESMHPESMHPESMQPESMQSESMQSESMRPESMRPESMRPEPRGTDAGPASPRSPFAELDAQPEAAGASGEPIEVAALHDKVIATLREIYDPEIPVNIYDLGLIYRVDVSPEGGVDIDMTLTTPGCPVAATFPGTVESMVSNIPEVIGAHVELVWDPPWTMDRMPEEVKLELGLL